MELKEKGYFLIPSFDNYVVDTRKIVIINLKSNLEVKPIKTSKTKKYKLSKNGMNHYLTLWEILLMIFSKNF